MSDNDLSDARPGETDYGRLERIATKAESYILVMDGGEYVNLGAVIRALYTDHRRLVREAAKLENRHDR